LECSGTETCFGLVRWVLCECPGRGLGHVLFVARWAYVGFDCVSGSAAQVHSLGVFRSPPGFSSDPVCRACTTHQTMVHGFIEPAGSRCDFFVFVRGCVAAEPVLFTWSGPPATEDSGKRMHLHGVVRLRIMCMAACSEPAGERLGNIQAQPLLATRSSCAGSGQSPVGL